VVARNHPGRSHKGSSDRSVLSTRSQDKQMQPSVFDPSRASSIQGRRGGGTGEPASHPVPPLVAPPAALRVLVTVDEAARMLSIARSHLYLQLQRGHLPSVLIGRSRRILVRDLEAYAEGLREASF